MITQKALARRTFLRGIGTAIALPFLDAMTPAMGATRNAGKPPVRMALVYVPNGIMMNGWNPDYEGKLSTLPRILKPLEPFKDDITLLGNLTHNAGRHQVRHLVRPDRGKPGRKTDQVSVARTGNGRLAPGRRLRFGLLLR